MSCHIWYKLPFSALATHNIVGVQLRDVEGSRIEERAQLEY